jgi:restriction endonuclease Mrr
LSAPTFKRQAPLYPCKEKCIITGIQSFKTLYTHVQEFQNVIKKEKDAGGFFVHTGRTGEKSYEFKDESINFISGDKLLKLLEQ